MEALFHDPAMTRNEGWNLAEKFCNQHQFLKEAERSSESYRHTAVGNPAYSCDFLKFAILAV